MNFRGWEWWCDIGSGFIKYNTRGQMPVACAPSSHRSASLCICDGTFRLSVGAMTSLILSGTACRMPFGRGGELLGESAVPTVLTRIEVLTPSRSECHPRCGAARLCASSRISLPAPGDSFVWLKPSIASVFAEKRDA